MVAVQWINETYSAVDANGDHDKPWWSAFAAVFSADLVKCFASGMCYGYSVVWPVNNTFPWGA